MAELTTAREAIALIGDGDRVAMEGFTHLIPHALGHEVIRQGRKDLRLTRMTPDVIYDQLIGMGCGGELTFGWGGNPGVGSLHRFRDAVENEWPRPLRLHERHHAALAAAYAAGASGLPFGIVRSHAGNDLGHRDGGGAPITCPFTGEELTAIPAVELDVGVIHAQQADRRGNVQLWGILGVQRETVLAAKRSIVSVEEVVDELEPRPGAVILPGWLIDAVVPIPRGAHPSYAQGYYQRENEFYRSWDAIAADRDAFRVWIERHVLATADADEYQRSIAGGIGVGI